MIIQNPCGFCGSNKSWHLEFNFYYLEEHHKGRTVQRIGLRQYIVKTLGLIINLGFTVVGAYPLSEASLKVDNFQVSIGIRYHLSLTSQVLAKGREASFSMGAAQNFYKYEIDKKGTILNPYSIRETIALGYTIHRFSISIDGTYAQRFKYECHMSELLLHSEEIGFDIQPGVWSIAIGHTNRTSWFSQIDQDSNLNFVDENSPQFTHIRRFHFERGGGNDPFQKPVCADRSGAVVDADLGVSLQFLPDC